MKHEQRGVGTEIGQPVKVRGQTGSPGAFGNQAKTEICGAVRETERVCEATELNSGLRVGARRRGSGAEPNDQGTPQLNLGPAALLGTNFDDTGNRVSGTVTNRVECGLPDLIRKTVIARRVALPISIGGNAETGDVNRSRCRLTPDERPVVDLSI